jgi:hypothetical protein
VRHLGNYVSDSIISENGDVWVYRYKHQSSPDSLAYFVYCPTRNGKKVNGFEIDMPAGFSGATQIEFADQSKTGNSTSIHPQNGKLRLDVAEVPKIILLTKS